MDETGELIDPLPSNGNSPSSDDLNLQTQQHERTDEYLSDANDINPPHENHDDTEIQRDLEEVELFVSAHSDDEVDHSETGNDDTNHVATLDTTLNYEKHDVLLETMISSHKIHSDADHKRPQNDKIRSEENFEAPFVANVLGESTVEEAVEDETEETATGGDFVEHNPQDDLFQEHVADDPASDGLSKCNGVSDEPGESDMNISVSALEDISVDVNIHVQNVESSSPTALFDDTDDENGNKSEQDVESSSPTALFDDTDDENGNKSEQNVESSSPAALFDDTDDENEVTRARDIGVRYHTPEKEKSPGKTQTKEEKNSTKKAKTKKKMECYLGNMVEWSEKMKGKIVTGKVHPNVIKDRALKNFWKEYPGGDDYPDGWIIHLHKRPSGNHLDWYWFTDKGQKFRSRNEIMRFLEQVNAGVDEEDAWEYSATNSSTHKAMLHTVTKSIQKVPAAKNKKTFKKHEKKSTIQEKNASKKADSSAKKTVTKVAHSKKAKPPKPERKDVIQGRNTSSKPKSEKRPAMQESTTSKKPKSSKVEVIQSSSTRSTQEIAEEKDYTRIHLISRISSSKSVVAQKNLSSKNVASPSVELSKRLAAITRVHVVPKRSRKDGQLPVDMQNRPSNEADFDVPMIAEEK